MSRSMQTKPLHSTWYTYNMPKHVTIGQPKLKEHLPQKRQKETTIK